jgi:ParB family chromosome partitioning protein
VQRAGQHELARFPPENDHFYWSWKDTPMTTTDTAPATFDDRFSLADLTLDENVRANAEATLDQDGLRESVREHGILLPVLAVRSGDTYRVRDGSRRVLAALDTGHDHGPVLIVGDDDRSKEAQARRLLTQWWAGTSGMPLTAADQARAVQGMLDLGIKQGTIAKQFQLKPHQVQAAKKVAASPVAMEAAGSSYQVNLLDAGVIAEFEHDEDATRVLLQTLGTSPGQFRHQAQRFREQADQARKLAAEATRRSQADEGLTVTTADTAEEPAWWALLDNLLDATAEPAEGEPRPQVTDQAHQGCPHRAVHLGWDYDYDKRKYVIMAWPYCADPKAAGHLPRSGGEWSDDTEAPAGGGQSAEQAAEQAAAAQAEKSAHRRWVIAGNREWRAARAVRQEWVTTVLLARRKPPAEALGFAVTEVARSNRDSMQEAAGFGQACKFLAISTEGKGSAPGDGPYVRDSNEALTEAAANAGTPAAHARILLGIVLGGMEAAVTDDTWRDPASAWRGGPRAARYLTFLAEQGYELSGIEGAAATRQKWEIPAPPATEDGGDD